MRSLRDALTLAGLGLGIIGLTFGLLGNLSAYFDLFAQFTTQFACITIVSLAAFFLQRHALTILTVGGLLAYLGHGIVAYAAQTELRVKDRSPEPPMGKCPRLLASHV